MLDLNWLKKWQMNGACHSQDLKSVFREVISAHCYGSVQDSTQSKRNAKVKGKHSLSTARAGLVVYWDATASHGSGRAPSTIRAMFVLCQKAGSLFPYVQIMTCTLPNTMCLFTFAKYFSPQKILFNYIIITFGVPNQLEFPASYSQEKNRLGIPWNIQTCTNICHRTFWSKSCKSGKVLSNKQ